MEIVLGGRKCNVTEHGHGPVQLSLNAVCIQELQGNGI
jgi:hypothetical protein